MLQSSSQKLRARRYQIWGVSILLRTTHSPKAMILKKLEKNQILLVLEAHCKTGTYSIPFCPIDGEEILVQHVYLGTCSLLQGMKCFVILLNQCEDRLLSENGTQGFVFPVKAETNETIPFLEVDRR
jgi:hypothetical protein